MSIADEWEDDFALPVVRRQVDLQPELLDCMWLDSSYAVLDNTLLAGGFLLNLDGHVDEPDHPLSAVARVQSHLFGLRRAEDWRQAIEVFKPLTRGGVPAHISLFIALSTCAVVGLSVSRWTTLGKTMGFWGVTALVGLAYSVLWLAKRRRVLRAARVRVAELRAALGQALQDTLIVNFVARHGDTLVTCQPHSQWAQSRLTDLERTLERTRSALPDAEAGSPEHVQLEARYERLSSLRSRLKEDIAKVRCNFEAMVEEPPAEGQWLDSGLQLDVLELRGEMLELGVEFNTLDSRFDRLLGEGG